MRLLGRTLSDFFNGLDNLHEYFRQSYPEMKRVSFIVSEESRNGLILHYRSKRKGYKMYVKGQILAVAKYLFGREVKIEVKEERLMDETTFVAFDVFFDNTDYQKRTRPSSKVNKFGLHVKQNFLFSLFPFNIVFDRTMMITNVGNSLFEIMPDILNQPVDDIFKLVKPMASLTWETVNKTYETLTKAWNHISSPGRGAKRKLPKSKAHVEFPHQNYRVWKLVRAQKSLILVTSAWDSQKYKKDFQ